ASVLGQPVAVDGTGKAVLTTTALGGGQHTIIAVYGGDDNFLTSSSASVIQQVNQAASTTTLVSSLNPTTFGQPFILTATVAAVAPGSGVPTGSVTFFDGTTALGMPVTLNNFGQAQLNTSLFAVGDHNLTAQYSGDSSFLASTSANLVQTVNKATSRTTLTSS